MHGPRKRGYGIRCSYQPSLCSTQMAAAVALLLFVAARLGSADWLRLPVRPLHQQSSSHVRVPVSYHWDGKHAVHYAACTCLHGVNLSQLSEELEGVAACVAF